jgi:hypothetical protein
MSNAVPGKECFILCSCPGTAAYVDHHASTTVDEVWRPWEDF